MKTSHAMIAGAVASPLILNFADLILYVAGITLVVWIGITWASLTDEEAE